jgi:hypothetical protein
MATPVPRIPRAGPGLYRRSFISLRRTSGILKQTITEFASGTAVEEGFQGRIARNPPDFAG